MQVGWDEALGVVWQPGQEGAAQVGKADHPVGLDRAGRDDPQLVLPHIGRIPRGVEGHATIGQQLSHRLGSGPPPGKVAGRYLSPYLAEFDCMAP